MTLNTFIKKFTTEEAGAITLEVLALGGVLVVVGVFVVASVSDGVQELDEARGYHVQPQQIISTF
jgi:hypothetical protein